MEKKVMRTLTRGHPEAQKKSGVTTEAIRLVTRGMCSLDAALQAQASPSPETPGDFPFPTLAEPVSPRAMLHDANSDFRLLSS